MKKIRGETERQASPTSEPGFASALRQEPLVRVVRRFVCPFCRKGRAKESAITRHMVWCIHNPDAKSCLTCLYYVPAEKAEYDWQGFTRYPGSPERCGEGIKWPHDQPKPRQCPKWEPAEERRGVGAPVVTTGADDTAVGQQTLTNQPLPPKGDE